MSSFIPSKFEIGGNVAAKWSLFIAQWCRYERTAALSKLPAEQHAAIFLAFLGIDAWELLELRQFDFEQCDVETIIAEVARLCVGDTNHYGYAAPTAPKADVYHQEQPAGRTRDNGVIA